MPIICAKCGEELLGAVNRCWKCGQQAISTPDSAQAPPVRRSPVRMESPARSQRDQAGEVEMIIATRIDDDENETSPSQPTNRSEIEKSDVLTEGEQSSPSIGDGPIAISDTPAVRRESLAATWDWKLAIPIGSLLLGLLSIGLGWLVPWMIIPAAAGIALGVLAITSRRKGLAFLALLICLIGITVSSVRLAFDTLNIVRGDLAPVEPIPEEDFFDPLDGMDPIE